MNRTRVAKASGGKKLLKTMNRGDAINATQIHDDSSGVKDKNLVYVVSNVSLRASTGCVNRKHSNRITVQVVCPNSASHTNAKWAELISVTN